MWVLNEGLQTENGHVLKSLYGDGKNKRQSFGGGTQAAFGSWAWEYE